MKPDNNVKHKSQGTQKEAILDKSKEMEKTSSGTVESAPEVHEEQAP